MSHQIHVTRPVPPGKCVNHLERRTPTACRSSRVMLNGVHAIVHYDDLPESDLAVRDGIPVTTALRTAIDIAPDVGAADLEAIVRDWLRRGLFTEEQARHRLAQPDMVERPGALVLGRMLDALAR